MPGRSLRTSEPPPAPLASDLLSDPSGRLFRTIALARCTGVLAQSGILSELAGAERSIDELLERHRVEREPLRLMLAVLRQSGLLELKDGRYTVARQARDRLDPDSPTSIASWLASLNERLDVWADLEFVASGGPIIGGAPADDDEAGWQRRIRSGYQYARQALAPLIDQVVLPPSVRSIIDVGGSHGWFSEVLCRRNAALRSMVLDAAPAVAVGRELMWECGLDTAVSHCVGDIYTDELGGPYDAAVCLPLFRGLGDDVALPLLGRIRAAVRTGAPLLVPRLDEATTPALELYLHLKTGVTSTTTGKFVEQLESTGFTLRTTCQQPGAELALFVAVAA